MIEPESGFEDGAVLRGCTYRYRGLDAVAIIERCREMEKRIYGIDAFEITDQTTRIADYIDYTGKSYDNWGASQYYLKYHIKKNADSGHWEEALQFVKDRNDKDWLYEIVHE
jgi:hypothetical protein